MDDSSATPDKVAADEPTTAGAGRQAPSEDRSPERIVVARYGVALAGIALLVCYGLVYTLSFRRNMLWENLLEFMPLVQKRVDGTLTLEDLWSPFGEHRLLGYKLVFLANAAWFGLNTLLEAALMPLACGVGAICLFPRYRRSLAPWASDRAIQLSFLVLAFLFISPNQYASFGNGMIVGLAIGGTQFVIGFLTLDTFLRSPSRRTAAVYALSVSLAIILFGSAYSTGFALGLLATIAATGAVEWRSSQRIDWRLLSTAAAPVAAALVVYMWPWAGSPVTNASLSKNLPWVLSHPFGSLRFLCMMLTSTVFSEDVFREEAAHSGWLAAFGAGLALVYGFAGWTFVKRRLWEITWVPFSLAMHALATTAMVLIGRSALGANYAFFPQYLIQTKVGLIGVLWILFLHWQKTKERAPGRLAVAASALVTLGQAYTNRVEWRIIPYRADLFDRGLNATLFDEKSLLTLGPGESYNLLYADTSKTEVGLGIARRYKLSAFSACPVPGRSLNDAMLLSGWYSPEKEGGRWIGRSAEALVRTGDGGMITVKGYVTPNTFEAAYQRDLSILITPDVGAPITQKLDAGPFEVRLPVCKHCNVRLVLAPSKFCVPQQVGIGPDDRELSVLISSLEGE